MARRSARRAPREVLRRQGWEVLRLTGSQIVRDPAASADRVIAPAGSGETTVLVERVRELRARGVPANRILCTTFNRKAVDELRQRLTTPPPAHRGPPQRRLRPREGIELSTVHGANGREWNHVILFAADDDVIPAQRALISAAGATHPVRAALEDERRIASVAFSRTARHLTILCCRPTRFLAEADGLNTEDATAAPPVERPEGKSGDVGGGRRRTRAPRSTRGR